jgi:hypothetical protein
MKMKKLPVLLLLFICCLVTQLHAQEKEAYQEERHEKSADELARELANPNSSLATLRFKNQYRWYKGDLPNADDQANYTLLFQPIFPFALEPTASGGKANFFVRPAIPIVFDQPVFDVRKADFDDVTAMGDIGFDVAYGVTEKSGFLWAGGHGGHAANSD